MKKNLIIYYSSSVFAFSKGLDSFDLKKVREKYNTSKGQYSRFF